MSRLLSLSRALMLSLCCATFFCGTATGLAAQMPLNLNQATAAQLETLPGIGPALAERIMEYKKHHGEFKTIHDLTNVSGIGEKTLAKFKDAITVKTAKQSR